MKINKISEAAGDANQRVPDGYFFLINRKTHQQNQLLTAAYCK